MSSASTLFPVPSSCCQSGTPVRDPPFDTCLRQESGYGRQASSFARVAGCGEHSGTRNRLDGRFTFLASDTRTALREHLSKGRFVDLCDWVIALTSIRHSWAPPEDLSERWFLHLVILWSQNLRLTSCETTVRVRFGGLVPAGMLFRPTIRGSSRLSPVISVPSVVMLFAESKRSPPDHTSSTFGSNTRKVVPPARVVAKLTSPFRYRSVRSFIVKVPRPRPSPLVVKERRGTLLHAMGSVIRLA